MFGVYNRCRICAGSRSTELGLVYCPLHPISHEEMPGRLNANATKTNHIAGRLISELETTQGEHGIVTSLNLGTLRYRLHYAHLRAVQQISVEFGAHGRPIVCSIGR